MWPWEKFHNVSSRTEVRQLSRSLPRESPERARSGRERDIHGESPGPGTNRKLVGPGCMSTVRNRKRCTIASKTSGAKPWTGSGSPAPG
jgi:hypothetical protein